MKKQFLRTFALCALGGTLSVVAMAQNIAIVNGKPLPKARLDFLVQQMAKQNGGQSIPPEINKQITERLITNEVFAQEAINQGIDQTDEYKQALDMARQTVLAGLLFENFRQKNPVPDADARAEYDKFVAENGGKEYKVRHILVEKEEDAKKIIADLKKGAKFEDLAKKQSKDAGSAGEGGDLGWSIASKYVPEFATAILKLNKGESTQVPVKSQYGWHVIRIDDVRPVQIPDYELVKPQIVRQLEERRLREYQQALRAKAKIE